MTIAPTTPASAAPSTPAPAPACPRSSPACRRPPAPACRGARSCCAPPGLALSVYGAGRLAGLPVFEEGIARAAGRPRRHRARQRVPRRRRRQPLDPRAGRRSGLPPPAPEPRARRGGGTPFGEDPRMTLASGRRAAGRAARRGQGLRDAGGRLRPPGPVALRLAPLLGGRRDRRPAALRLARPVIDRIGTADNPLQGVSLGGSLGPSLAAAADAGGRRRRARGLRLLGARRLGPARRPGAPGVRRRRPRARGLARPRGRAGRAGGGVRAAASARRWRRSATTASPRTRRGRSIRRAARSASRTGSPASRRCSAPACRSAARRSPRPGAWDTHADQAGTLPDNLKITADSLFAFQRDLEARGIADRVLTLVWSEFGRRAEENGSGTDHGAAGIGFVIGTRASGRMIGEFPGLAQLDPQGNLRATSDFRGLYSALAPTGSASTPPRCSAAARAWRGRRSCDEAGARPRADAARRAFPPRPPRGPRRRGCSSRRASSTSRSRARS